MYLIKFKKYVRLWIIIFILAIIAIANIYSHHFGSFGTVFKIMPHQACTFVKRGDVEQSIVYLANATWQLTVHPRTRQQLYFYAFYYDKRSIVSPKLTTFLLTDDYLEVTNDNPMYCYAWYKGVKYPDFFRGKLHKIEISHYEVRGVHYVPYMFTCDVNTNAYDRNPQKVSVAFTSCNISTNEVNTLIPVHLQDDKNTRNNSQMSDVSLLKSFYHPQLKTESIPENKDDNKRILVCTAAQYGKVDDKEAFFFIQWMEFLLMSGVHEVVMYNASLNIQGDYFTKVLKYYIDNKKLYFYQLPAPFPNGTDADNRLAAELIRYTAINDCVYRNYHRFWYILHIDRDEVPVLQGGSGFTSYQEFLESVESRYGHKVSVVMPSAYFYRKYFPAGNPSVSESFPLLRYTYRLKTEEVYNNNAAFKKSFINPIMCEVLWSHRCLIRQNPVAEVSDSEVVVHHYRTSCRMDDRCTSDLLNKYISDDIPHRYGARLNDRTLLVANSIGLKLL